MTHFLVIGSGRWAQHLQKSLALARVSYSNWARRLHSEAQLGLELEKSSHVWLAVSDQALQEWADRLRHIKGLLLHSSGALEIKGVHSVHPLGSFSFETYPDNFYRQFAFVTTSDLPRPVLIDQLPNPLFKIPATDKIFYHSLCVLAGNGSVLLWQKFFSEMQKMGLSREVLGFYAQRIFENLLTHPESALTGPLVRNDYVTLQKDLNALENDPYQKVLQSLALAYQESRKVAL